MALPPISKLAEAAAGGKYNPLSLMLSMVDETPPSRVDKVFKANNLSAAEMVGAELSLRSVQVAEDFEERFGENAQPEEEIARLALEIAVLRGGVPDNSHILAPLWHQTLQLRQRISAQQDRPALMRLSVHMAKISAFLQSWSELGPEEIRENFQGMKEFLAQERCALRFREIAQNPAFGATARLRELHHYQQRDASANALYRHKFQVQHYADQNSFAPVHFLRGEEIALEAAMARDEALMKLWEAILGRLLLPGGAPVAHTAAEARTWMDQNPEALAAVQSLTLTSNIVPPEIGKLTGLKDLLLIGTVGVDDPLRGLGGQDGCIRELPGEMANLQQLEWLFLQRTKFDAFPSVLSRLPNLWLLTINGNQPTENTYTTLSDEDWRHLYKGWLLNTLLYFPPLALPIFKLFMPEREIASMQESLGPNFRLETATFGQFPEKLTDYPFGLWFQEHFTIQPSVLFLVPTMLVLIPGVILILLGHLAAAFTNEVAVFVGLALGAPFAIAAILTLLAVNLPILAFNFFMMKVVEPIVTLVREQAFGLPRMVHRDPEPADPAEMQG